MSEHNRLSAVRFGADGLVPVVTQESRSGDILMLAYANRDALDRTLSAGLAHYYSRSRGTLWQKGETSGQVQRVTEVRLDCDGDAVLYRAEQEGSACHTGARTCFPTVISRVGSSTDRREAKEDPGGHLLSRLARTIAARVSERPEGSYTAQLLYRGIARISRKVGGRRWSWSWRQSGRTTNVSRPRRLISSIICWCSCTHAASRWMPSGRSSRSEEKGVNGEQ